MNGRAPRLLPKQGRRGRVRAVRFVSGVGASRRVPRLHGRRRADERMTDMGLAHLPNRLARSLLARTSDTSDGALRLAFSQSEIADMVGSSRESVNRALRNWHPQGIVELKDGSITVLSRDAPGALAECV